MINKKIAYFTLSLWIFGLLCLQFNDEIKNANRLLNFQLFTLGLFTQWSMIQFGLSCCDHFGKRQSEYTKYKKHDEGDQDNPNVDTVVIKIS